MCFRVTLLIVALAILVHTGEVPEKKCGMAYVFAEPKDCEKHPPVILVHGLSYTKESWNDIYEEIPDVTRRRVIAYDVRNHGKSFWSDRFSIPIMVDDLKCFMDALKIVKAVVVGHSMGGLVAMQYALKYPRKVERLCVEDIGPNISSASLDNDEKELNLLVDSEKAVPEKADKATAKKAMVDYIQQVAPGTDPQGVFFQKMPVIFRDGAWHWQTNFKPLARSLDEERRNATLGKYQGHYYGKCLFIYSIDSPLKVGEQKELIKGLYPKAKFFTFPGAEHTLHRTHPKEFLTALNKFLNCQPVGTE